MSVVHIHEPRVRGLTMSFCGLRHEFDFDNALRFGEALNEARVLRGEWTAAGFLIQGIHAGRQYCVRITGWDMGPMFFRCPHRAEEFLFRLLTAAREKENERHKINTTSHSHQHRPVDRSPLRFMPGGGEQVDI